MPVSPQLTWNLAGLQPMYPSRARQHHVRLPASVSYAAGQILGEQSGTDEAQTATLSAGASDIGGTYTLSFGGSTTTAIAFNAAAATVQAALELLPPIGAGNVKVTGTTPTAAGGVLTVTFINALGNRDVAALTGSGASLTGTSPVLTIATATAGAGNANEQQSIYKSGTVSGGTFQVVYSGQTTAALAYNATPAQVQTALEDLSNVQPGDVTVTGTAGTIYVLKFGGTLTGDVAAVTIVNTSITGGGSYLVATPVGGAAGTPGTFIAFDAAGTDGRQVARAILAYDCTTDASGNHSFAQSGVTAEWGAFWPGVPAFFDGDFRTGDLVGFTEAALASNPAWKLINGTVANGVLSL